MNDERSEAWSEQPSERVTNENCVRLSEIRLLASKLAESYAEIVELYETDYQLSHTDAVTRSKERTEIYKQRIRQGTVNQLTWHDLGRLQDEDPALAVLAWEKVKQTARDDLESGHYLMKSTAPSPMEQAQFIAIREAFLDQWRPTNKGEQLLIDMLAQLYHHFLYWMDTVDVRTSFGIKHERREIKRTGRYNAPELTEVEAEQQAAEMCDRFNRLFLRTLRAYRDVRRWSAPMTINNPAQVNIAATQMNAQQVKVKEGSDTDAD